MAGQRFKKPILPHIRVNRWGKPIQKPRVSFKIGRLNHLKAIAVKEINNHPAAKQMPPMPPGPAGRQYRKHFINQAR